MNITITPVCATAPRGADAPPTVTSERGRCASRRFCFEGLNGPGLPVELAVSKTLMKQEGGNEVCVNPLRSLKFLFKGSSHARRGDWRSSRIRGDDWGVRGC